MTNQADFQDIFDVVASWYMDALDTDKVELKEGNGPFTSSFMDAMAWDGRLKHVVIEFRDNKPGKGVKWNKIYAFPCDKTVWEEMLSAAESGESAGKLYHKYLRNGPQMHIGFRKVRK